MKIHLSVQKPMLFDLDSDVGEKKNVYAQHPQVAAELMKEADRIRAEIGDVQVVGSDQRPHHLINPQEKN